MVRRDFQSSILNRRKLGMVWGLRRCRRFLTYSLLLMVLGLALGAGCDAAKKPAPAGTSQAATRPASPTFPKSDFLKSLVWDEFVKSTLPDGVNYESVGMSSSGRANIGQWMESKTYTLEGNLDPQAYLELIQEVLTANARDTGAEVKVIQDALDHPETLKFQLQYTIGAITGTIDAKFNPGRRKLSRESQRPTHELQVSFDEKRQITKQETVTR